MTHPVSAGKAKDRTNLLSLSVLGGKQLPVSLGDDFDGAVGYLDGGLVVDRVRRRRYPRGPLFCDGHVLVISVVHVRNNRKINQSDSLSLDQDHAEDRK